MSYKDHFNRELKVLRDNLDKRDKLMIEPFIEDIYSIIDKFAKEGHSGASAPYGATALANTIKDTLLFKPLSPLTGKASEWGTVADPVEQNNRLSSVFKEDDGRAYYLNAIVWQGEDNWDTFTGSMEGITSRQYIKFPFTPKTFYIDVYREVYDEEKHGPEDSAHVCDCGGNGKQVYFIKDRSQLDAVKEYYDFPFEPIEEVRNSET